VPLIPRKRIFFGPPLQAQVGANVLASDLPDVLAEYAHTFLDPCLVMALVAVTHSNAGCTGEFVQPLMDLGVRFAE
jgi:hypothetical protein